MKPLSNRVLQKLTNRLCKDFFDNMIPPKARFGDIDDDGLCVYLDDELIIHSDYARHPDTCVIIVMHELKHYKISGGNRIEYVGQPPSYDHGMRFEAETVRLFEMGAYDGLL